MADCSRGEDMNMTELDKARFWVKVTQTEYCWIWSGAKNRKGYGEFRLDKNYSAHRLAYMIIYGEIEDNLHVLHKCDNTSCVNPGHLFLGTHKDNMQDKVNKERQRTIGRSSKYHGVGWRKDSLNWRSSVRVNGKIKSLGSFESEIEAARIHDKESRRLGILNNLNFPEEI